MKHTNLILTCHKDYTEEAQTNMLCFITLHPEKYKTTVQKQKTQNNSSNVA